MQVISQQDKLFYTIIRQNVCDFLNNAAKLYDDIGTDLLDIAPQIHEGAKQYFKKTSIFTADIDPLSNSDYIIDICNTNSSIIPNNRFNIIVCTEVLEHTLNPFNAISELYRILKPNGILLLTTPFNFRIHGPIPDCWRFTEYGLKELLKNFSIVTIKSHDTDRFLMPLQYLTTAIK